MNIYKKGLSHLMSVIESHGNDESDTDIVEEMNNVYNIARLTVSNALKIDSIFFAFNLK
jgi:hypothetical protein